MAEPAEGDIVVFERRSRSNPEELLGGHVGFLISQGDAEVRVLGGSQRGRINTAVYP